MLITMENVNPRRSILLTCLEQAYGGGRMRKQIPFSHADQEASLGSLIAHR
jgi:hypothetical protein